MKALLVGFLALGPILAFAGNCKKLAIIRDDHFAAECAFDTRNAGSFEETYANLKLVVKCYHLSENIFTWNKKESKQFTYNVKRVDANSGLATIRNEEDQYFERIETNGSTVKLLTWSARFGKRSLQTSILQCLQ